MNAKKFLSRILRARNLELKARKMEDCGYIIGNKIVINFKRQTSPARTFIHECLHYFYPDMPHAEVYANESEVWKKLNNRQVAKIYQKMVNIYSC